MPRFECQGILDTGCVPYGIKIRSVGWLVRNSNPFDRLGSDLPVPGRGREGPESPSRLSAARQAHDNACGRADEQQEARRRLDEEAGQPLLHGPTVAGEIHTQHGLQSKRHRALPRRRRSSRLHKATVATEWRESVARAKAEGTFFFALPHHCAVGRKPN